MAQHYSDRTKNRLKAEGVYNLSVQDYEVLPISTCWCNFLPTSCSTWTHSAAQKRDSWWRIGKNGLRHPQISKGSSWNVPWGHGTLSGMSLNDEAAFEAVIYFTKAWWHDMIWKKTQMFLSEWSTFPEKNDSPLLEAENIIVYKKTQILKQAFET